MKTHAVLTAAVLFVMGLSITAHADYVKTSRPATLRALPHGDADIIIHVDVGVCLPLIDSTQANGYYHVLSDNAGREGWIYRTLVRRYPGDPPVDETADENPMADPTYHLTAQANAYAARHLRIGKPQAVYERSREGYVLAQDGRLKIPLWVQYELTAENLTGAVERTEDFHPDASIPYGYRAELSDYSSSGYDRGHQAPAGDMTRSEQVMSESFLLSNMAPQIGIGFNRQIWKNLESAVRGWVEQRGSLTIITGPVFEIVNDDVSYKVIGPHHVAVPTHFFKIVVDVNDPRHPQAIAFLLPNDNLTGHQLTEYFVPIDSLETLTGLDFLSALPVNLQNEVEKEPAAALW